MEKEKLCLRCMRKIGDSNVCPYCKNEKAEPQGNPFLPLKTVVGGKYLIGKLVSHNSDGATYYAFDLEKKRPVTLREFFPDGLVSRGEDNYCLVNVGKASAFIDEKSEFLNIWETVKSLTGFSAIPEMYAVFEDLGTVYAVGEYLGEAETLREYLLRNEQGFLPWEDARVLLMPVLSGLEALHKADIYHRGISPTTLVVTPEGKVKLTGFSVCDTRNKDSVLADEIFDGYAAIEQYGFEGKQGAWTDIYAFCAVLYRTLIGSTPMSASSRISNDKLMIPGKFAEQLPAYVINALVNGLQILPGDRTDSVEVLRDELAASPVAAMSAAEAFDDRTQEETVSNPNPAPPPMVKKDGEEEDGEGDEVPDAGKVKRSTIVAFVISIILCIAILFSVVYLLKRPAKIDGEKESTEAITISESTSLPEATITSPTDITSITLPSFAGKNVDDIKNDATYKLVLNIETEYIDDESEVGTVISQSLPEGTQVSSVNKRSIKLVVSNGKYVPDVTNKNVQDAVEKLKDAGFTNVETQASQVASRASQSNVVYSLVYFDAEKNDWAPIPSDRRISPKNKLILYYYGEFVTETVATTVAATVTETETVAETSVEN